MILRTATTADIPAMATLLGSLFSIEADFTPDTAKQVKGLELLLASPTARIFVAENEGKVIGMCTVQLLVSTAAGEKIGSVEDVVVDPAFRGQGVGNALLQTLEQWAESQGLARLQLQADKDNAPALHFYAKQGWTTTRLVGLWKKKLA